MKAGRAARGLVAGAALGGLIAAADGLLCGLLLSGPTSTGVFGWVSGFALGGAAVGALIGLGVAAAGSRMVLQPPEVSDALQKRR